MAIRKPYAHNDPQYLKCWADRLWPCRYSYHEEELARGLSCEGCGRVANLFVVRLRHQDVVVSVVPGLAMQLNSHLIVASGEVLWVKDPAEDEIRPVSLEDQGIVVDPAEQYWITSLEDEVNA